MLRSLVGSEMCIRDRPTNVATKTNTTLYFRYPTINEDASLTNGRDLLICLLYTSDAADDLLCVDLGGRRIIKKKKKTKTYLFIILHIYTNFIPTPLLFLFCIFTTSP